MTFPLVIRQNRVMPFPAPLLQHLILDVESYPLFLPLCRHVSLLNQTETSFTALLKTVAGWQWETYVLWEEGLITLQGERFQGTWTLMPAPHSSMTSVVFYLSLTLSRWERWMMHHQAVFLTQRMMAAFVQRAFYLRKHFPSLQEE